ncbi:MAG: alpha/beta hydrolase [Lentisphaeria bacterium]|nr:alpha/beta hydrolase [Lentisphaeria bacterium]
MSIVPEKLFYGEHSQQYFLFYKNPKVNKAAPLILFFHGGGFKKGNPENFPQELLNTAIKNEFHFVSATYRFLQHESLKSDYIDDGIACLDKLVNIADSHQINLNQIITAGNSAGAHISAPLAFENNHPDVSIIGTILENTQPIPNQISEVVDSLCPPLDTKDVITAFSPFLTVLNQQILEEFWFKLPLNRDDFENDECFKFALQEKLKETSIYHLADRSQIPIVFYSEAPDNLEALLYENNAPKYVELHSPILMQVLYQKLKKNSQTTYWVNDYANALLYIFFRTPASIS